jgi:hypothetical protein
VAYADEVWGVSLGFLSLGSAVLAAAAANVADHEQFMVWSCGVSDASIDAPRPPVSILRLQFAFSRPSAAETVPAYFRVDDPNRLLAAQVPKRFFLDRSIPLNGQAAVHGVFSNDETRLTVDLIANANPGAMRKIGENMAATFAIITRGEKGQNPDGLALAYSGDCRISLWPDRDAADRMFEAMAKEPRVTAVTIR